MDGGAPEQWWQRPLRGVGWLAIVLLTVLLLLPLLLLPLTTAVPAPAWIGLLALFLLLVVLLVRGRRRRRRARVAALGGMVTLVIAGTVASQVFAATPAIVDAAGTPLPLSVATLEKVTLNGSEQWITIRGHDLRNPVLLNLGMGGPGGGGFATRTLFEPLEEFFTVVSWDEPGTGKSIHAVPSEQLTKQRFIDDGLALTRLLRARFGQERIHLYGVSWSSILAIWLVQAQPDYYATLATSGQMVNTTENDRAGYQLALDYSQRRGDTATVARLRANGPPPYTGPGVVFRYLDFLDVLNDYMGGLRYSVAVPIVPFLAPEYGYVDKVNHTIGMIDSFNTVYPQLADLDFRTQATRLEVPVWFFVGRKDVNAMASLVEDYYGRLSAPGKQLIWLNGGHGLDGDSLPQFVEVMVHQVRQTAG